MPLSASFPFDIPVLDSAGAFTMFRVGPLPYDPSRATAQQSTVGVSSKKMPVPAGTAFPHYFYVKNKHASAILTIVATPQSAAQGAMTLTVGPGSFVFLCDPHSRSGSGYSSVTIVSDTVNTPYDYFIGD